MSLQFDSVTICVTQDTVSFCAVFGFKSNEAFPSDAF